MDIQYGTEGGLTAVRSAWNAVRWIITLSYQYTDGSLSLIRCFDVALNSIVDKEITNVSLTGVYTVPAGKASIILGSLKQDDERLENRSDLPLGENCILILVLARQM